MKLTRKIISTEGECPRCRQTVPIEVWNTASGVWPYTFIQKHDCTPKAREEEVSMGDCCERDCGNCACGAGGELPPTQTISNVGGMLSEAFSPPQYPPPESGAAVTLEPGRAWLYYDDSRTLHLRRDGVDLKVLDFDLATLQALGEWVQNPPVSAEEGMFYVLQVVGATRPVRVIFEDGREANLPEQAVRGVPVREAMARAAEMARQAEGAGD